MGNVSSVPEGEGEWQQQEREGQGFSSHLQGGSEDLMRHSPPKSPSGAARPPLLLTPQESVPEDMESIADSQPPQSPDSSYNNWPLDSEDLAKEPPSVPPHLRLNLLNEPANRDSPSSLSRPRHVVLNHLYIQKGKRGQPVVALGATRRFRSKYVTVVLYKSLQR